MIEHEHRMKCQHVVANWIFDVIMFCNSWVPINNNNIVKITVQLRGTTCNHTWSRLPMGENSCGKVVVIVRDVWGRYEITNRIILSLMNDDHDNIYYLYINNNIIMITDNCKIIDNTTSTPIIGSGDRTLYQQRTKYYVYKSMRYRPAYHNETTNNVLLFYILICARDFLKKIFFYSWLFFYSMRSVNVVILFVLVFLLNW